MLFKIVVHISIVSIITGVLIFIIDIGREYYSKSFEYSGVYEVGEIYVADSTMVSSPYGIFNGLMYLDDNWRCKVPWRYGIKDDDGVGTWGYRITSEGKKVFDIVVPDTLLSGEWIIHDESYVSPSILRRPYVSSIMICNKHLCLDLYRLRRKY